MPFYRAGPDGGAAGSRTSSPESGPAPAAACSATRSAARKPRMIAARTRPSAARSPASRSGASASALAPDYDFTRAPNGGRLLYERFDWGLTAGACRRSVRASARLSSGADGDDAR